MNAHDFSSMLRKSGKTRPNQDVAKEIQYSFVFLDWEVQKKHPFTVTAAEISKVILLLILPNLSYIQRIKMHFSACVQKLNSLQQTLKYK